MPNPEVVGKVTWLSRTQKCYKCLFKRSSPRHPRRAGFFLSLRVSTRSRRAQVREKRCEHVRLTRDCVNRCSRFALALARGDYAKFYVKRYEMIYPKRLSCTDRVYIEIERDLRMLRDPSCSRLSVYLYWEKFFRPFQSYCRRLHLMRVERTMKSQCSRPYLNQ